MILPTNIQDNKITAKKWNKLLELIKDIDPKDSSSRTKIIVNSEFQKMIEKIEQIPGEAWVFERTDINRELIDKVQTLEIINNHYKKIIELLRRE